MYHGDRERPARVPPHSSLRADLDEHMTMLRADDAITTPLRERSDIPVAHTWRLDDIFPSWEDWEVACRELEAQVEAYAARQGSLSQGPEALLSALQASDVLGKLAYRVYYFASLAYDQDQRDNTANARRQRVQILLARWRQATSWFNPELLAIPLVQVREWMATSPELAVYRFAIEDLYRQQEHVLDEKGEHLLSLSTQFGNTPEDSYDSLSVADARFPTIRLSTGEDVQVTYPRYREILATNRNQADRAAAFTAHHQAFADRLNTYAAIYNGVLQRDWFHAQARAYPTMLEAALHANNIPVSVVETLVETTRAGTAPLRRYERLRRRALGLSSYHHYDGNIPLVDYDRKYPYAEVQEWIIESAALVGPEYQNRIRRAFRERWIDVYENAGKQSGAYSAAVYGVHPYMLLNYNDTLDAVFTLAHEMGHSMHTMLAHESQPFVYSGYTIFVAEVPSTLSEALLLDYMLARATDPRERIVLLQHAIDEVTSTFYRQVLFATFELETHRLVERREPVTADELSALYMRLFEDYYADAVDRDDLLRVTWARIPHFFASPYYVYQYATCFASSARLLQGIRASDPRVRADTVEHFLALLRAGSSDHPMALLQKAGVDLSQPETVEAIVGHLDDLVARLERELDREPGGSVMQGGCQDGAVLPA
jgi:oligoendopeptidase F